MMEILVVTEDNEWQLVSLDQLKVTTGKREVQQTASGFLSLNTAKTRAQLTTGHQRHVLLQFRYRGQTPDPEPNQSGEIVAQIGVKLRTLNTCNVVYVMWRITQPEGIVVKLKRNPGQSHHKECGANGYISIAPSSQVPLTVTATDQRTHRLNVLMEDLDGAVQINVQVDGEIVWTGEVSQRLLECIDGPAGFRTDNGSFIFKMFIKP
jgi:hypothetical protein